MLKSEYLFCFYHLACLRYHHIGQEEGELGEVIDALKLAAGEKALEEAWTGEDRVSALFAIGGDIDAIECIKCASRLNIQVPFDLSIAGFDDIYISEIINPSLTTIKQPKFEIGATAMRILKSLIDGDDVEEEMILLPFEYIARESVNAIG